MKLLPLVIVACLAFSQSGCSKSATADSAQETKSTTTENPTKAAASPKARHFRFHYQFDVAGLKPGKQARIWLPVAQSNDFQLITALPNKLPGASEFHTDPKYGNKILYIDASVPPSGQLQFDVPYDVQRTEVRALNASNGPPIDSKQRALFLKANAKVPVDGRPLKLLGNIDLSDNAFQAANQLYELVDEHVTYNKEGTGWGNGDSVWVCDSKRGNCTDFHSLFISLARSQGIPSRFEIGFPIPAEPEGKVGGYHCWAWSHIEGRGWIPVDISEADKHPELKQYYFGSLTPDRVTFSVGRDIELRPAAAQKTLNFFVYPHIEVDGQVVPKSQLTLKFSYANVASNE